MFAGTETCIHCRRVVRCRELDSRHVREHDSMIYLIVNIALDSYGGARSALLIFSDRESSLRLQVLEKTVCQIKQALIDHSVIGIQVAKSISPPSTHWLNKKALLRYNGVNNLPIQLGHVGFP